ncbi:alpha/beta-hydrolase [Tricholoma matsutake]|nr:alpha/beta-hydrolase [Tricholoma matsutake 945]
MVVQSQADRQYGNPSLMEKVSLLISVFLYMPIVLAWTLLSSPFHRTNRLKTWTRVLGDKAFYYLTKELSVDQLQWAMGDTGTVYKAWVKQNGLPVIVDELSENTRLLWIDKQRTDRVILYFHGGGFLFPMQYFTASFWKYIKAELKKKNIDAGVAILNYTLVPSATFPTQLEQAVVAIEHLLSTGVQPQNIQIAGDSAGGNLAIQLISHILHPVLGVRPLKLPSRIRGIFLMSPWVKLQGTEGNLTSNDGSDILSIKANNIHGKAVLEGVPDSWLPYVEASRVPDSWFKGVNTVVERMLVTAGSFECGRDSIEAFANQICSVHDGATFWIQENGVHNDPFFDFFTKEAKLGRMTPQILEWFATGFGEV